MTAVIVHANNLALTCRACGSHTQEPAVVEYTAGGNRQQLAVLCEPCRHQPPSDIAETLERRALA